MTSIAWPSDGKNRVGGITTLRMSLRAVRPEPRFDLTGQPNLYAVADDCLPRDDDERKDYGFGNTGDSFPTAQRASKVEQDEGKHDGGNGNGILACCQPVELEPLGQQLAELGRAMSDGHVAVTTVEADADVADGWTRESKVFA